MAKSGSKLSDKKLAAIQADYEAGIVSKSDIAKKHRINRYTLLRNAKRLHWVYGKSGEEVTRHITKKATEQIVEKETLKLVDFTEKHIKQLDVIRGIANNALYTITKKVTEARINKRDLLKEEVDGWFNLQKFCKISSETLAIIYRDERLAMGLEGQRGNSGDIEDRISKRMNKLKNAD